MKIGVVDVGGGLRGIYAAGVLDYCLDHNIFFDLGIGVSAGSANLASYVSRQKGRNYQFYTEYAFRKEYMSIKNFIVKRSYIDMDYVYGTLCQSNGENPLNYLALKENPMELYVVATNAMTGQIKYFNKRDIQQNNYDILKASSSIPFVCAPYIIQGIPYFDGALGDPVPVEKAFQLGCDYVVVILTKPENEIRSSKKDEKLSAFIKRKYPISAAQLCQRASKYNESVEKTKEYARRGKALIVAPDNTCGVDTLTRNKNALKSLYAKGYQDGKQIANFLKKDDE